MTDRILIIDDDIRLGEMLVRYLTGRGFEALHCEDATTGLDALAAWRRGPKPIDALVLDVMLPDLDGFEVCRRVRADPTTAELPIVMLTARGDEMDRIVGLELGADDYLPKPFNPRELLARLRAVLRRATPRAVPGATGEPGTTLRFGDEGSPDSLVIDPLARRVLKNGVPAELTSHQFSILRVLAERAGRVQTRDALMEAVRGQALEAFDRSIDVHISRIRAAIEDDPGSPQWIQTVRGVGYVFSVPRSGRREPGVGDHDRGQE